MPRKTDSSNPTDWLLIAESDLAGLRMLAEAEISYAMCRGKLAEVLEKVLKAELLRLGWFLVKTHDLEELRSTLGDYHSDLMPRVKPLCQDLAEAYFTTRYPGFDLEDADWPKLRDQLSQVTDLAETIKARLPRSG